MTSRGAALLFALLPLAAHAQGWTPTPPRQAAHFQAVTLADAADVRLPMAGTG